MLLNDDNNDTRLAVVSMLTRLANHGEFVAMYHLDVTNIDIKSSFAGQQERRFHHWSLC
jgi:hypothetical protein